jgi:signal recognition particle receptor subunit beta
MDFGRLTLPGDLALYLFGTPGQERFEFMWDILAEGMLGLVVMVDPARADVIEEARRILETFAELADVPHVVAVNKATEGDDEQTVADVRARLRVPDQVPVMICDARDRDDVKEALVTLLHQVRDHVRAQGHGPVDVRQTGGGA